MQRTMTTLVLALGLTVMVGLGSAQADVFNFSDSVIYWNNWSSPDAGDNSQDVIGTPQITGGSITYTPGSTISSLVINYTSWNDDSGILFGDVFLDVTGDNNWDYVIDVITGEAGHGTISNNGATAGDFNIYAINLSPINSGTITGTPDEYQGYVLSNEYFDGGHRENHPVGALSSSYLSAIEVGTATWTGDPTGPGSSPTTFSLTWYTGQGNTVINDDLALGITTNCANDVVMARTNVVPIPGAVWLLGSGLLGLIGWRRRNRN